MPLLKSVGLRKVAPGTRKSVIIKIIRRRNEIKWRYPKNAQTQKGEQIYNQNSVIVLIYIWPMYKLVYT